MMKRKSIALCIALMASTVAPYTATVAQASTPSVIQKGAQGSTVIILQQTLNKLGYSIGTVDGQFGSKTTAAVEAFQKAAQLPVTGVVDAATWVKLLSGTSKTSSPATVKVGNQSIQITNLRKTKIYFGSQLVANPYAFTAHQTTYMPIWYLMHALQALNIQSTWDGKELALTVPDTIPVNLSSVNLSSAVGVHSVSINGSLVVKVTGIPYPDPYTNKVTMYMPIWYLQRALTCLYIQSGWNGTEWSMVQQPLYRTYSTDGTVMGTYTSLNDAKQALANVPGGTVKDQGGNVLYTQPQPAAYTAYQADGTRIDSFTSLTDAEKALLNEPGGTVKDATGKVVYTQPQPVIYTAYTAKGAVIGTYSSLNDAKNALSSNPGGTVKDSTGKLLYTQPVPITYTAYQISGDSIGTYPSLTDAESAIVSSPGATVKDSNGQLVYTQAIAYSAYAQNGTLYGIFSALADAQSAVRNVPGGTVRDKTGNIVSTQSKSASYRAFSDAGTLLGSYGTFVDAENALANTPDGVVKDTLGSILYTEPNTPVCRIYQVNGVVASTKTYRTLTDAEADVTGIPGGMVKDSAGNVVYVQSLAQPFASFSQTGGLVGIYSSLTDAEQALGNYPGGVVKNMDGSVLFTEPGGSTGGGVSNQGFSTVDLRFAAPSSLTASSIDAYLSSHGSPMAGLGQTFMFAQKTYGVDANYLVSHAILESAWGKSSIALAKDNLFGYGAYDSNPGTDAGRFPSYEYAIRFQAWEVRQNYLTPGSNLYVTPTLVGMNVHYATDKQWANSISGLMGQLASSTGDSLSSYQQYTPSKTAPGPSSSSEPVFALNGAKAVIAATPYYSNLPYYSDWSTGNNDMFVRTLQAGQFGGDVSTLQRMLNQKENAKLVVDGAFGAHTTAALKQYQTSQGLPVTGTCDFKLWSSLVPPAVNTIPAKTAVTVDKMMQGMSAGIVMEWYHIPNYGWVDSQDVKFTNTFRLTVNSPTAPSAGDVSIYNPNNPSSVLLKMHAGDWIVCNNTTPVNGFIQIQFVNQQTGQAMQGMIDTSEVSLTPIQ